MRIFQVSSTQPWYRARLERLTEGMTAYGDMIAAVHHDGWVGVHTLEPVLSREPGAFYTHANNERIQRAWAREKGLPANVSLDEILFAQIEEHRPDVFYALSTAQMERRFVDRLPAGVKARVGFNAAPKTDFDMSGVLVLCNIPSRIEKFRAEGLRSDYFTPSHAPVAEEFAANTKRDIDVVFAGTYSRHHVARSSYLDAVARLQGRYNVVFALLQSRLNLLAETPLGWIGPLRKHARPQAIRQISRGPAFGRDYFELMSRSKIVFNGAPELSADDRGNMRCWEALGVRSLMVSDAGNYPDGMKDGATIRTYRSPKEAVEVIEDALANPARSQAIADAGYEMVRTRYSKQRQWDDFQKLVAAHFG